MSRRKSLKPLKILFIVLISTIFFLIQGLKLEISVHNKSSALRRDTNEVRYANELAAYSQQNAFPPGCSWQCYLRQNHDLLNELAWDEAEATDHYLNYGVHDERNCACKVLILAGPHKAASSAFQAVARLYSRMDNVQWHWIGERPKSFAAFVLAYFGEDEMVNQLTNETGLTYEILKERARTEIELKYGQGYNIIYGSEEIDRVTSKSGNGVIDEVLDILPTEVIKFSKKHLSSLVVYRAPRSSHLKSMWGEVQFQLLRTANNTNTTYRPQSFKEYVCTTFSQQFNAVDSLYLANKLLQKGLNVQLFDMSALKSKETDTGMDIFSVLGCDAMNLQCVLDEDTNSTMPNAIKLHWNNVTVLNRMKKSRNMGGKFEEADRLFDVSDQQMTRIDDAMNRYDCFHYQQMQKYVGGRLEILHGNLLQMYMMKCRDHFAFFSTKDEVMHSINEILDCQTSPF